MAHLPAGKWAIFWSNRTFPSTTIFYKLTDLFYSNSTKLFISLCISLTIK